jgi:hypothetical protein
MCDAVQESKAGNNTQNNGQVGNIAAAWEVCTLSDKLASPLSNMAAGLQPKLLLAQFTSKAGLEQQQRHDACMVSKHMFCLPQSAFAAAGQRIIMMVANVNAREDFLTYAHNLYTLVLSGITCDGK